MKKYDEIFHLLRSNHLAFKNNKLVNTSKYKNCVNATSGLYYTDKQVDVIVNSNKNLTLRHFVKRHYKTNEYKLDNLSLLYSYNLIISSSI